MDIILPDLPDTSDVLVPPKTIFYPPVVEEPFLDPILLPSLEQVESGLQVDQGGSSLKEKESTEEVKGINPEQIPKNLPQNLENT